MLFSSNLYKICLLWGSMVGYILATAWLLVFITNSEAVKIDVSEIFKNNRNRKIIETVNHRDGWLRMKLESRSHAVIAITVMDAASSLYRYTRYHLQWCILQRQQYSRSSFDPPSPKNPTLTTLKLIIKVIGRPVPDDIVVWNFMTSLLTL